MLWANFLHIYQPPNQKRSILDQVVRESYSRVLQGLVDNPTAHLTLNINACLSEMLLEFGYEDIINQIIHLSQNGQIELTASGKYHPLLPKLPPQEVKRQIELNHTTNRQIFGSSYSPRGFFPPEMGYSSSLDPILTSLGINWVILDEIALPQSHNLYATYKGSSTLQYIFRERDTSYQIQSAQIGSRDILTHYFASGPRQRAPFVVTAMDGETFGHHRPGLDDLLLEVYNSDIQTTTISRLLSQFPPTQIVEPLDSNWAMTGSDLARNLPFIRWSDPDNTIHSLQWQLVDLALSVVNKDTPDSPARILLDKALHSDQFWWASCRPWWSLEMIERGAHELTEVVDQCSQATHQDRDRARDLYLQIITLGFAWQRTGKVERLSRQEDEELRARISDKKPYIQREEYNHMIEILKQQMTTAASNLEFTRAEQIKKRIQELELARDSKQTDFALTPNL